MSDIETTQNPSTPHLPPHILRQIVSHFRSGNKIFWHTDLGHYSQPCWDPTSQSFSLVCKDFRMLVMERRFRRFVIRGSDDWAERVKMGDLMREEIRESIRSVLLLRTFRAPSFPFFSHLPNLSTLSNLNLANPHLFLHPRSPSSATNPFTLPTITTLRAPSSDFMPLDQLCFDLISPVFPSVKKIYLRPDVERYLARLEASPRIAHPLIVLPGSLEWLILDMRRLDSEAHGTGWERGMGFLQEVRVGKCSEGLGPGIKGDGELGQVEGQLKTLELVFSWQVCRGYAGFMNYLTDNLIHASHLPLTHIHITITPSHSSYSTNLSLLGPSNSLFQQHLPTFLEVIPSLRWFTIRYVNLVDWDGNIEEVEVARIGVEVIIDKEDGGLATGGNLNGDGTSRKREGGVLVGWRIEKKRMGDGDGMIGERVEYELGIMKDDKIDERAELEGTVRNGGIQILDID